MGFWGGNLSAITLFEEDHAGSAAFYTAVCAKAPVDEDDVSALYAFGPTLSSRLDVGQADCVIAPGRPGGPDAGSRVQLTVTVAGVGARLREARRPRRGPDQRSGRRPWGGRTACFADPSALKSVLAQPLGTSRGDAP